MSNDQNINWITNFLWGIADDVLRDLYVRGKYRDVILPMVVLQRLDAVLATTKDGELFKQFQDNESFKTWLTNRIFEQTYDGDAA